jgi:hypothetical protein
VAHRTDTLEHQTGLNPREVMSDAAGYSDVIFGLFWLLGYQFSPAWPTSGRRGSGGSIRPPTMARRMGWRGTGWVPS